MIRGTVPRQKSHMRLKIGISSPSNPQEELEVLARFDLHSSDTFITKSLLEQIKHDLPQGARSHPVSSSGYHQFHVSVPTVDLSLRHGQTRFVETALVVESPRLRTDSRVVYPIGHPEEGYYNADEDPPSLSLGRRAIENILGAVPEPSRTYSAVREVVGYPVSTAGLPSDPAALEVSLYPVGAEMVSALNLERFLESTRYLHNFFALLDESSGIKPSSSQQVEDVIKRDVGLSAENSLFVARVEHGSIVLMLKSGVLSALRRLASIFKRYSEAVESQSLKALAEARQAGVEADIREATRNEAIERARTEELAAADENRQKSYEQYRRGVLATMATFDELLVRVDDGAARTKMRQLKDQALLQLAERLLLPISNRADELPENAPSQTLPPGDVE